MNGKESAMAKMVIVATRLDANEELASALRGAGHEVSRAGAMSQVQGADVVFAEPGLFAAAPASPAPDVPVVVTAAPDQIGTAIDALRLGGAYDLLRVPCASEEIDLTVWRALRCQQLLRENAALRTAAGQEPSTDPL